MRESTKHGINILRMVERYREERAEGCAAFKNYSMPLEKYFWEIIFEKFSHVRRSVHGESVDFYHRPVFDYS